MTGLRSFLSMMLVCSSALIGVVLWGPSRASADVLTNDVAASRNAWDSSEPNLTPAAVTSGTFGQSFATKLQGAIMGQPVIVGGVLVATTEDDRIYGLDPITGAIKWTRHVGTGVSELDQYGCGDLPESGITSTPVVDPTTDAVYFTDKAYVSGEVGAATYRLHAVNALTGLELPNFPVTYGGTADNDPTWTFDANFQTQRPGLLLSGGVVYAAFGSMCDLGRTWSGWVMGNNAVSGQATARFVTEAGQGAGSDGGIWQSGAGLTSDGNGQILLVTGNGNTPAQGTLGSTPPGALGESVIRLSAQPDGTLKASDFFSPVGASTWNAIDGDLGSGGVVDLPSSFHTATASELMAVIGKSGYLYLLNGKSLGGMGTGPNGSDASLARVGPLGGDYGTPVGWPGGGGYLYLATVAPGLANDGAPSLTALKWSIGANGAPSLSVAGSAPSAPGFGSSSPVISSNGTTTGSGTLWYVWQPVAGGDAQLQAYNPIPVNGRLQLLWSAPIGRVSKFLNPVLDNGRVYTGSADGTVRCFAQAPAPVLSTTTTTIAPTALGSTTSATVTLTAAAPVTVSSLSLSTGPFALGSGAPTLPVTMTTGQQLKVPVTFRPVVASSASTTLSVGTDRFGSLSFGVTSMGLAPTGHLAVSSKILDLGTGVLAGAAPSAQVTITNNGLTKVTISSVSGSSPPFQVTKNPAGALLAPAGSVTLQVALATTAVGSYTSKITVTSSAGQQVAISLVGAVGQPAVVTVSPSGISYGSVPLGSQVVRTITLTNTGDTPATWDLSRPAKGAKSDIFMLDGALPSPTIPAHGTQQLPFAFVPNYLGQVASPITFTFNNGLPAQQVWLSGVGASPTNLVANLESTNVQLSDTVAQVPLTVFPASPTPVTVTVSTSDGTATAQSGAYSRLVNKTVVLPAYTTTTTIPIAVNPSKATNDSFTVSITSARGATVGNAATVYLWASSSSSRTLVNVEPAQTAVNQIQGQILEVPIRVTDTTSATITCTATTSDGTASAGGGNYTALTGAQVTIPPSGFGEVPITIPAQSGTFGSEQFTVTLSACTGAPNTTIDHGSATVWLDGDQGTQSSLEVSTALVVLRAASVGSTASASLVVTNVGGGSFSVGIQAQPPQAAFVFLGSPSVPVTLGPGQSRTFTIQYRSPAPSTYASHVTLLSTSAQGNPSVSLIGQTG